MGLSEQVRECCSELGGKLATACGATTVVVTHNSLERDERDGARKGVAAQFKGQVVLAEDLQRF